MSEMIHPHAESANLYGSNLHLAARILAVAACITAIIYIVFAAGELHASAQSGRAANSTEVAMLIGFTVGLAALILSWFWQLIGGVVAVAAGIFIAVIVFMAPGTSRFIASFVYGSPFLLVGIFLLVDYLRERQRRLTRVGAFQAHYP
jgi:hypothetical protein